MSTFKGGEELNSYLFTLWRSVQSGPIRVQEIAEILNLSTKQTARYIKSWENEGWFTFTPGRGRGNVSQLKWLMNVEEVYEETLIKMIETEPIEESSKYLLMDWSPERKLRLMNRFQSKFGFQQNVQEKDRLIIPRKYPFTSFHPLDAVHVLIANLVATIYNRLVSIDEKGNVKSELAHSWDVSETNVRLYLKKDIKFHDGSLLTANDVVKCLEKMRQHPEYANLWEPVDKIVAVTSLIVDIDTPTGCSYILQLLGTMVASIYKETENGLVGTGPFYLAKNTEVKTKLLAFREHFQERPLLDEIEFIQVPKDYDTVYTTHATKEPESTVIVESNSGFGVVIMNACRDSDIRRQEVRDYIHWLIAKHRYQVAQISHKLEPNDASCLSLHKEVYPVPEALRPTFTGPIILMQRNWNEPLTNWLRELLIASDVPVKVKRLSFSESIYENTKHEEIDLYIHGEVFEMNESFSFYYFLKNGYSPLARILDADTELNEKLQEYTKTPFPHWEQLHREMEQKLIEKSLMIPLYHEKREIPFSKDIMNIQLKYFGYVDFSKLWVRPKIE